MRRVLRAVLAGLAVLLVAAMAAAFWARAELRGSLAVLDGELQLPGLSAPVEIERDALGIPSVRGASRGDVARATGFLHAQDRFFQMDLARRRAAGELAALAGPRALALDREIRIHRFRAQAQRAVAAM
ncbi:MAG: penicillin acylase family protein, partial [Acidimicrobiia bacterium]|nr:penicillin acylase family protein [Acidimicrobiia bacterium]